MRRLRSAVPTALIVLAVASAVGCYGSTAPPVPTAPNTPLPVPIPTPTPPVPSEDGGQPPVADAGQPGPDAGQPTVDAGTPTPPPPPVEAVITIQNFTFSPANLIVDPGTTVRVRNLDAMDHSVTSMSAAGAFTPGAVAGVSFDTGAFQGERTFTIPAGAPHGTTVPYFCTVHLSGMRNSGQVTVR